MINTNNDTYNSDILIDEFSLKNQITNLHDSPINIPVLINKISSDNFNFLIFSPKKYGSKKSPIINNSTFKNNPPSKLPSNERKCESKPRQN